MSECEFEFARRQIKKEQKKPNVYSQNRVGAMLERVYKKEGERAVRELRREFKV